MIGTGQELKLQIGHIIQCTKQAKMYHKTKDRYPNPNMQPNTVLSQYLIKIYDDFQMNVQSNWKV